MIAHLWTAACSDSSVDGDSHNITLFQVFTRLNARLPRPPEDDAAVGVVVEHKFHVVTCWGRADRDEPAKGWGRMVLVDPKDKKLLQQEYPVDLTESAQHHQRAAIQRFPLTHDGRYFFRIDRRTDEQDRWRTVARAPLDVHITWTEGNDGRYEKRRISSGTQPA